MNYHNDETLSWNNSVNITQKKINLMIKVYQRLFYSLQRKKFLRGLFDGN